MDDKLSTSDILIFLAASEFLIIIIIALVAFLFVMSRRKKSDSNATANLANKIKSKKIERKSELSSILSETYNIEGDKLKKETEKLIKMENQFYQRFIKTYLTRDADAVEMIDEDLKELLKNYNQLVPKQEQRDERAEEALAVIDNLSEDQADYESQISRLKETINNLSDDLKQYKNTINRLFFEYSAMFGVDVDPRNQLTASEILSRLETGRLGDEEPSLSDLDEDDDEAAPLSEKTYDDTVEIEGEPESDAQITESATEQIAENSEDINAIVETTEPEPEPVITEEAPIQQSSTKEAPPAQPIPDELIAELLGDDAVPTPSPEVETKTEAEPEPESIQETDSNSDETESEPEPEQSKSDQEMEEDEFEKEFAALVNKNNDS